MGADWQYKIDAVYLVAFLNFCPMDFDKQFRTDVGLIDRKSGKTFSDKARMTFMQLPYSPRKLTSVRPISKNGFMC